MNIADLPTLWQIATALDSQQETLESHDGTIKQLQMLIDKLTQANWEQAKLIADLINEIHTMKKVKCE